MRSTLSRLVGFIAFSSLAAAQPQVATVTVDQWPARQIELSSSTSWLEAWSAGAAGRLDVWMASRKQGAGYTIEYELSARTPVSGVGSVTIEVPGYPSKYISVGMDWPAGRSLSGRVGEEIPLLPNWSTLKQTFGPLSIPLPTLTAQNRQDLTNWAGNKLSGLRTAIANRTTAGFEIDDTIDGIYQQTFPYSPAWIGPWACWTKPDPGPGVPGSSGIYHTTGWQDVEEYARLACEVEALAMGRMWCFLQRDGTSYGVDRFLERGLESPYCNSDAGVKPPAFVGPDPLWRPISLSHYSRVLRYCMAAYEMTGSRLARRHLIQLAESARLQFSEAGPIEPGGGGWIAFNLSTWEVLAGAAPGTGLIAPEFGQAWDRSHGWMLWAAAAAKKAGMTWTRGWNDWATRFVIALTTSQMPNGLFGRAHRGDVSTTRDVTAAMHEAILGMGLLAISVQSDIPVPSVLSSHAHALYQVAPAGPYAGGYGPKHFLVVGLRNGPAVTAIVRGFGEPSVLPASDTGDPIIAESYLAAVYALTGQESFAAASLRFGSPAASRALKVEHMTNVGVTSSPDLVQRGWEAYLLAQLTAPPN